MRIYTVIEDSEVVAVEVSLKELIKTLNNRLMIEANELEDEKEKEGDYFDRTIKIESWTV